MRCVHTYTPPLQLQHWDDQWSSWQAVASELLLLSWEALHICEWQKKHAHNVMWYVVCGMVCTIVWFLIWLVGSTGEKIPSFSWMGTPIMIRTHAHTSHTETDVEVEVHMTNNWGQSGGCTYYTDSLRHNKLRNYNSCNPIKCSRIKHANTAERHNMQVSFQKVEWFSFLSKDSSWP